MDEVFVIFNICFKVEVFVGQIGIGIFGFIMFYWFFIIEEVWERIKFDFYWVQGVWDKERVIVNELVYFFIDEMLKFVS